MNKSFCIIIPIYKKFNKLDIVENISINRICKVLHDKQYPIILIGPKTLDHWPYFELFTKSNIHSVRYIPIDDKFFKSTQTYSKLLIRKDFYDNFSDYDNMFIIQLDCYIWRDEFQEWSNTNFDYIGAPIFTNTYYWKNKIKMNQVFPIIGNGGLSMRNVKRFQYICDEHNDIYKNPELKSIKDNTIYEDLFFCNEIAEKYYYLKRPSTFDALRFAWDFNVEHILKRLKIDGMPMGMHSIDKNIRIYKDIIPEFNSKEVIDYCEKKNKDFFKYFYQSYK